MRLAALHHSYTTFVYHYNNFAGFIQIDKPQQRQLKDPLREVYTLMDKK